MPCVTRIDTTITKTFVPLYESKGIFPEINLPEFSAFSLPGVISEIPITRGAQHQVGTRMDTRMLQCPTVPPGSSPRSPGHCSSQESLEGQNLLAAPQSHQTAATSEQPNTVKTPPWTALCSDPRQTDEQMDGQTEGWTEGMDG